MVRRQLCVPMITLCLLLLLTACSGETMTVPMAEEVREPFQTMQGCSMEAVVRFCMGEQEKTYTLSCLYRVEGESEIEVLAPETVAGIRAVISGESLQVVYEEDCLDAGTISSEEISPAVCLVQLMEAMRSGWLLEENEEVLDEQACLRLCLDRSGENGGEILSTLWLRQEDGLPVRGEIAVDGTIILQVQFTSFQFDDILKES